MKLPLLLCSLAAVGLAALPQSGSRAMFAAHDKVLKDAKGLEITFTVQQLPGSPVEHKLFVGRPGMIRIEGPAGFVVSDGKMLWEYTKADNTFNESPTTPEAVAAKLAADETWAWSAFLLADQFKNVKTVDAGVKRVIRGNQVVDITIGFADGKGAHFYFDPKLGMARGASVKGANAELLILATDVKLGEAPATAFTFTAPAGAKKAEKPKVEEVPYSAVAGILRANCLGCHGGGGTMAGYSVATYDATIRGGRGGKAVIPGDPDHSSLYLYVAGMKRPRMPKDMAPLSQKDIATIKNWIASGAKQ